MKRNSGIIAMLICMLIVIIDGIFFVGDNCWGSCQVGHSFFALFVLGIGFAIITTSEPNKVKQVFKDT